METDSLLRVPPDEPEAVFRMTVRRLLLEGYSVTVVRDAMQEVFFASFVDAVTADALEKEFDY